MTLILHKTLIKEPNPFVMISNKKKKVVCFILFHIQNTDTHPPLTYFNTAHTCSNLDPTLAANILHTGFFLKSRPLMYTIGYFSASENPIFKILEQTTDKKNGFTIRQTNRRTNRLLKVCLIRGNDEPQDSEGYGQGGKIK